MKKLPPTFKFPILLMTVQFIFLSGCSQSSKSQENDGLNRLANASSPYLRQHADNPVNWYEWGDKALQKAKDEDKPLIISIGYSSCHWCHVMEHESFMDTAVARLMNENFVSIKIDREERPDIDQIYMNAAQLISGGGGWPLNAFALPDGSPFYAATYFPKDQWMETLKKVAELYRNDKIKLAVQAENLTRGIQSYEVIDVAPRAFNGFSEKSYEEIFAYWRPTLDFKSGGFTGALKFPLPVAWEFLLQNYYLTRKDKSLEIVTTTLDEMAKGGIYDQIGGGFARYSTDEQWKVPHFEKMLYDNGQLVSLYSHAFKLTKKKEYEEVIRETLAFVAREMTDENGGFYSSINADSEGEEGKFYVWKEEEIRSALPQSTAELIVNFYQVSKKGNWEQGKNILYRKQSNEDFAKQNNLSLQEWKKMLDDAKEQLQAARDHRIRPTTDDKILTSWNALMMQGYLDAYLALQEAVYLEIALKNARFLEKNMVRKNGQLYRSFKDGRAGIDAFLDDYALLARSFISFYESTFDVHWLELARSLTEYAVAHFRDDTSGMFFYTSKEQAAGLVARKMEIADNVIPSSNSVMAEVLFKLGIYFYKDEYVKMSEEMLSHVATEISEGGAYYANWGRLLGLLTYGPFEIAIMGEEAVQKNHELQSHFLPTSIFMGGTKENLPLLENKLPPKKTLIYVCRDRTCKLPVTEVSDALGQMVVHRAVH